MQIAPKKECFYQLGDLAFGGFTSIWRQLLR